MTSAAPITTLEDLLQGMSGSGHYHPPTPPKLPAHLLSFQHLAPHHRSYLESSIGKRPPLKYIYGLQGWIRLYLRYGVHDLAMAVSTLVFLVLLAMGKEDSIYLSGAMCVLFTLDAWFLVLDRWRSDSMRVASWESGVVSWALSRLPSPILAPALFLMVIGWVDLVGVFTSGSSAFTTSISQLTALRAWRLLLVLEHYPFLPSVRVLFNTIYGSLEGIFYVLLVVLMSLTAFSLFGMEMWMGLLRGNCGWAGGSFPGDTTPASFVFQTGWGTAAGAGPATAALGAAAPTTLAPSHCPLNCTSQFGGPAFCFPTLSGTTCPSGPRYFAGGGGGGGGGGLVAPVQEDCVLGASPSYGQSNWDTFGAGLLNAFTILTQEGWSGLMYSVSATWGASALVFVVFFMHIMLTSCLLELALAELVSSYQKALLFHEDLVENLVHGVQSRVMARLIRAAAAAGSGSGGTPPRGGGGGGGGGMEPPSDGDAVAAGTAGPHHHHHHHHHHRPPTLSSALPLLHLEDNRPRSGPSFPASVGTTPRQLGGDTQPVPQQYPGMIHQRRHRQQQQQRQQGAEGESSSGGANSSSSSSSSLNSSSGDLLSNQSTPPPHLSFGLYATSMAPWTRPRSLSSIVDVGEVEAALEAIAEELQQKQQQQQQQQQQQHGGGGELPSDLEARRVAGTFLGRVRAWGGWAAAFQAIDTYLATPFRPLSRAAAALVTHPAWGATFQGLVVLNAAAIALEGPQPGSIITPARGDLFNVGFVGAFVLEAAVKHCAYGAFLPLGKAYWSRGTTLYEGFACGCGVLEVVSSAASPSTAMSLTRILRVVRMGRLVFLLKAYPGAWALITVLGPTAPKAATALVLFILALLFFAIWGKQLFPQAGYSVGAAATGGYVPPFVFNHVSSGFLAAFQAVDNENSDDLLKFHMAYFGSPAALFLVTIILVGNLFFLNMFITIVTEAIMEGAEGEEMERALKDRATKKAAAAAKAAKAAEEAEEDLPPPPPPTLGLYCQALGRGAWGVAGRVWVEVGKGLLRLGDDALASDAAAPPLSSSTSPTPSPPQSQSPPLPTGGTKGEEGGKDEKEDGEEDPGASAPGQSNNVCLMATSPSGAVEKVVLALRTPGEAEVRIVEVTPRGSRLLDEMPKPREERVTWLGVMEAARRRLRMGLKRVGESTTRILTSLGGSGGGGGGSGGGSGGIGGSGNSGGRSRRGLLLPKGGLTALKNPRLAVERLGSRGEEEEETEGEEGVKGSLLASLSAHAATVAGSTPFKYFSFLFIGLSLINLILDEPRLALCPGGSISRSNGGSIDPFVAAAGNLPSPTSYTNFCGLLPYLRLSDMVITAFFVGELLLKWGAYGLVGGAESLLAGPDYIPNGWGILDILVVAISIATYLVTFGKAVKILRAARVFRVARVISQISSLRVVTTALLQSLLFIGPPMALILILAIITALAGMNQLQGLTYACNYDTAPIGGNSAYAPSLNATQCAALGSFPVAGDLCTLLPSALEEACCRALGGSPFTSLLSSNSSITPTNASGGGGGYSAFLDSIPADVRRVCAGVNGGSTVFTVPAIWAPFPANFETFSNALLTSFELMVSENWPVYVKIYMTSTGGDRGPSAPPTPIAFQTGILFLVALLVLSHVASKIFVGIMLKIFFNSRNAALGLNLLTHEQRLWVQNTRTSMRAKAEIKAEFQPWFKTTFGTAAPSPTASASAPIAQSASSSRSSEIAGSISTGRVSRGSRGRSRSRSRSGSGEGGVTLGSLPPSSPPPPPPVLFHPIDARRATLFTLVSHPTFSKVFMALALLNLFAMASKYLWMPPTTAAGIGYLDAMFTALFLGEMVVLILALGPRAYWRDGWKALDGSVSLLCGLMYLLPLLPVGSFAGVVAGLRGVLRLSRILRILRIARAIRRVELLMQTIYLAAPAVLNIILCFCTFIYIASIIAMNLFSRVRYGWYGYLTASGGANFDSFLTSFQTLFRCTTGENFNGIMHELTVAPPYCSRASPGTGEDNCGNSAWAYTFFVAFIFFATFVILNLVTAIMLEAYEEATAPVHDATLPGLTRLTTPLLAHYRQAWAALDAKGTNFLGKEGVVSLIVALSHPLGLRGSPEEGAIRAHHARVVLSGGAEVVSQGGGFSINSSFVGTTAFDLKQAARKILAKSSLVPFYFPPPPPPASPPAAADHAVVHNPLSSVSSKPLSGVGGATTPGEGHYHFQAVLFSLLGRANGMESNTDAVHLEGSHKTNEFPEKFVTFVVTMQRIWRQKRSRRVAAVTGLMVGVEEEVEVEEDGSAASAVEAPPAANTTTRQSTPSFPNPPTFSFPTYYPPSHNEVPHPQQQLPPPQEQQQQRQQQEGDHQFTTWRMPPPSSSSSSSHSPPLVREQEEQHRERQMQALQHQHQQQHNARYHEHRRALMQAEANAYMEALRQASGGAAANDDGNQHQHQYDGVPGSTVDGEDAPLSHDDHAQASLEAVLGRGHYSNHWAPPTARYYFPK